MSELIESESVGAKVEKDTIISISNVIHIKGLKSASESGSIDLLEKARRRLHYIEESITESSYTDEESDPDVFINIVNDAFTAAAEGVHTNVLKLLLETRIIKIETINRALTATITNSEHSDGELIKTVMLLLSTNQIAEYVIHESISTCFKYRRIEILKIFIRTCELYPASYISILKSSIENGYIELVKMILKNCKLRNKDVENVIERELRRDSVKNPSMLLYLIDNFKLDQHSMMVCIDFCTKPCAEMLLNNIHEFLHKYNINIMRLIMYNDCIDLLLDAGIYSRVLHDTYIQVLFARKARVEDKILLDSIDGVDGVNENYFTFRAATNKS